jgi:hypothetical protein
MRLGLAIAVLVMMSGIAGALTTDSVTLTVTPVYNLSVNIVNSATNFGLLDIGSSKTLNVGTIWNDGNVSANWEKCATNSSNGTLGWTLDPDGYPGQNNFSLLAIATNSATTPTFEGAEDESIMRTSAQGYVSNSYTDLVDGVAAVSAIYPSLRTATLWVSLMMPTDITVESEQTITLSIRAANPAN